MGLISFFADNIGTLLTGLVLLVIIAASILKVRRDSQKGRCAGCSRSQDCEHRK